VRAQSAVELAERTHASSCAGEDSGGAPGCGRSPARLGLCGLARLAAPALRLGHRLRLVGEGLDANRLCVEEVDALGDDVVALAARAVLRLPGVVLEPAADR